MNDIELKRQLTAAIALARALGSAIKEAKGSSLGGIPSGHLYAVVMGKMSLETYQGCIDTLKRLGLVEEKGYLLTWIGG